MPFVLVQIVPRRMQIQTLYLSHLLVVHKEKTNDRTNGKNEIGGVVNEDDAKVKV